MAKGESHGNTIWGRDTVYNEVQSILDDILKDKTIVYLGEVYETRNYPRRKFSEWEEKFKSDKEISETIAHIKDVLESRINLSGLRELMNPAMVKFNLINNYAWREKSEVDNNTTLKNAEGEALKLNITALTPEEVEAQLQSYFQK